MGPVDHKLIKELPPDDRPREKLARLGPAALSDAELLAIFLRTGTRARSAIVIATELIASRGSLAALAGCSAGELAVLAKGVGTAKAAHLAAAFELGRRLARQEAARQSLDTPQAIHDLMAPLYRGAVRESLHVVLLDTRRRLLHCEEVSRGSLNESIAHPREVLRPAVVRAAHSFVLTHNHPSGDPSPSEADRSITRRLRSAAEILQIEFLDHVIIGSPGPSGPPYFSFREHGLL